MAQKKKGDGFTLRLDPAQAVEEDLHAYLFDETGKLVERKAVEENVLELESSSSKVLRGRLFLAPALPEEDEEEREPTLGLMRRLNAHEPILKEGPRGSLREEIRIPESVIGGWNLCFCWIRGRVVRSGSDGEDSIEGPVCGARVHICEVDRLPRWIVQLPDPDIIDLRDDLWRWIKNPPIPVPPEPFPEPIPDPFPPVPGPGPRPDPGPIRGLPDSPLRFEARRSKSMEGAEAERLGRREALSGSFRAGQQVRRTTARLKEADFSLDAQVRARLLSESPHQIRQALLSIVDLLPPFFCFWPRWWWRFDCDEFRVVETDSAGRFEALTFYPCDGDKPDLYFWVEYEIGGTWQTVYRPPIACNTWWNYECGTEVTLTVTDSRVPVCSPEPNLPGLQVAVMSIGNRVSIKEIHNSGASEGLTDGGRPFGGRLEPHVWFSRENLRDAGVTHYRWSYRRLTGPDGTTPELGSWTVLTRTVGRHYSVVDAGTGDLSFPFYEVGPDAGAPIPNLFEIWPVDPPSPGIDWVVLDARHDTATGYFQTRQLPHGLPGSPSECRGAEETAGKYELKLELFDSSGDRVNWSDQGIDLKIADDDAPFGTGTVSTIPAPSYLRLEDGGDLVGFRMVLWVDNNCCHAEIQPISGANLSVNAACGFITYQPGAVADVSFEASHPNDFATFNFDTDRGLDTDVSEATTSGKVDDASTPAEAGGSFNRSGETFSKNVPVSDLLDSCTNAAFAERLWVRTMATDGWHRLGRLDRSDVAAFALAEETSAS